MINFIKGESILTDLFDCEYWECWTETYHYMIWQLSADVIGCPVLADCPAAGYTPPEGAHKVMKRQCRSIHTSQILIP